MKLPYAEDINFWKTGRSSPDVWMDRAKKQITNLGGSILSEAFGHEATTGQAAFMLSFSIKEDKFKIVWPVLPQKYTDGEKAARIQAATMLYHDVKNKCITATVWGPRVAFFQNLLLSNGRMASEMVDPELLTLLPDLFKQRQIKK